MRITKKDSKTADQTPKKRRTGRKIAIGVTAVVLLGAACSGLAEDTSSEPPSTRLSVPTDAPTPTPTPTPTEVAVEPETVAPEPQPEPETVAPEPTPTEPETDEPVEIPEELREEIFIDTVRDQATDWETYDMPRSALLMDGKAVCPALERGVKWHNIELELTPPADRPVVIGAAVGTWCPESLDPILGDRLLDDLIAQD